MILILTNDGDLSSDLVQDWLDYYNHPFIRINTYDFINRRLKITLTGMQLACELDNKEFHQVINYFTYILKDRNWLTDYHSVNINKFDVLWQAARCGLNVPDSYIVNSKMDLKDLTGKIISKSILDPILPSWGNKHKSMMYTTILDKNNFEHLPKMFNLDYFCMIHTMHISRYLHNIEKFEITKI